MATIVWTVFAVVVLIGIFAACVISVVIAVRLLESWLGRRALRDGLTAAARDLSATR